MWIWIDYDENRKICSLETNGKKVRGHKIHVFGKMCSIWKTFFDQTDNISRDWVIVEATYDHLAIANLESISITLNIHTKIQQKEKRTENFYIPMRYSF